MFLQISVDALPKADMAAHVLGIPRSCARGGLLTLWEWSRRRGTLQQHMEFVLASFDVEPERGPKLLDTMFKLGFLTKGRDGALAIVDNEDRLGLSKKKDTGAAAKPPEKDRRGPPWIPFDFDDFPKADMLAHVLNITRSSARGGAITMLEWAWRHRTLETNPTFLAIHWDITGPRVQELINALVKLRFVSRNRDGSLSVVDDHDRLGIGRMQRLQAGAAKSREKRRQKLQAAAANAGLRDGGSVQSSADQPEANQKGDQSPIRSQSEGGSEPDQNPNQSPIRAQSEPRSEANQSPISSDHPSDRALIGFWLPSDRALIGATKHPEPRIQNPEPRIQNPESKKYIQPPRGNTEPSPVDTALPSEIVPRGDHAARASRDEMNHVLDVERRNRVISGLVKAFARPPPAPTDQTAAQGVDNPQKTATHTNATKPPRDEHPHPNTDPATTPPTTPDGQPAALKPEPMIPNTTDTPRADDPAKDSRTDTSDPDAGPVALGAP